MNDIEILKRSTYSDGSQIKSYPRNLPSLVRREDTTRKDARERRKQRKEEELAKRKEEVRRLKGLKVKEIRTRLERAGVATGEAECKVLISAFRVLAHLSS